MINSKAKSIGERGQKRDVFAELRKAWTPWRLPAGER